MKAKAARELVRLHDDGWERWAFVTSPGDLPRRMAADEGSTIKDRILSVPARHVVALPLWVDSTDEQFVRESLELELEVRGVLGRKKSEEVISVRTLEIGERTLVIGAVFPTEAPQPPGNRRFRYYEASPFLVRPESDVVMLWREGNDLVALFTRERQPVYWATLDWPAERGEISRWLQLISMQIVSAGFLAGPPGKVVIDESLKSEKLDEVFPDRPQKFVALFPSLEEARFVWKPENVRRTEDQASVQKKLRTGVLAVAGAYLLIALMAGMYLGWLGLQVGRWREEVAQLEKQTDAFQPTVRAWQMVGPGAESDFFPLAILHRVVQHMPEKGIRLTLYETNENRITVEGDAASAVLASEFFNALSRDKELFALNWQMPAPALLPDNAAHFQLTGMTP